MKILPHLLFLIPLWTSGCSLLGVPAVQRLEPEDQKVVDNIWDNMLTPNDRLDRDTLLDVLLTYQLLQTGVDRLTLTSEKDLAFGRVVMTVRFDRADPSVDMFGLDVYGQDGQLARSERYASAEVFARARELSEARIGLANESTTAPATGPTTQAVDDAEARALVDAAERRYARIQAATQPATQPALEIGVPAR